MSEPLLRRYDLWQRKSRPYFRRLSLKRKISLIRDLIIGCNYSFKDILALNGYPFHKIGKRRFFLLLASQISAKLSREKKESYRRNNYLVFMETMFESLVLGEYKKFETFGKDVKISLTSMEKSYLFRKSDLWKKVNRSLRQFIIENDDEPFQ